jgi:tetratricopeptide (TPR) repeat protein
MGRLNSSKSFIAVAGCSILFWVVLGRTGWSPALFITLSLASFMIGCVVGFLLTSYGDEAANVGKVRDWLIGGLAGFAIAKFTFVRALLITFAGSPGPQAYALTVGVAVVFAALGFFTMYLVRELFWNVEFALGRKRRGLIEGNTLAGVASRELLSALPPHVFSGAVWVDDWTVETKKSETDQTLKLLDSHTVKTFLEQAEDAANNGAPLDWDVVSKAAVLNYYLYYSVAPDLKEAQLQRAIDWVRRALIIYPSHVDLTAKYADLLNAKGLSIDAVILLRQLSSRPESPAYVIQWLSAYLLAIPGNEEESIKLSEKYLALVPSETDTYFNIARAYAALYNRRFDELGPSTGVALDATLNSYRANVMDAMKKALDSQAAGDVQNSKDWIQKREVYARLLKDPEFKKLVS